MIEALILYLVFFLPGLMSSGFTAVEVQSIPFSPVWELNRIITYIIPALALIWYIVLRKKSLSSLKPLRMWRQDLLSFAIGLTGLISIALAISFIISLLSRYYGLISPPQVEAPENIPGWIVMVIACLGTGYLEESYFRYYLLTKLRKYNLPSKVILSTVLFAFSHIHDGFWGILNALLAGILLSLLFIRYRSLHGTALAHGAYNIFVYTMGVFL